MRRKESDSSTSGQPKALYSVARYLRVAQISRTRS
jgi:hypothetical protein